MELKKIKAVITVVALMLSLFQSSYAETSPRKTISDTAIQNAILVHINEYRKQHGLPPLAMDNRIIKEAKNHSIDMANHTMSFGHKYFKRRIDRLHDQIKNSGAAAENVAYNYKDAQDVVKNWVRSPGHRRNIEGNYNLTGIGIARDSKGKIYFTQIFLKTGNSGYTARRPAFNLFNKSIFRRSV
ncbi:CAP domain-containing protein [Legionella fallonii]|uniref:SCP domain-containing protein n=1 Tax=Legionella fallonii LLAP-10 TaxID=1212491 RepID=A0A098G4I0_9GAMM|nr:CAP domain-containing protein [Legionella fallonii]CEG56385.1 conserved hypothetical protein with SCP/PR1 domains; putative signal peptide [Legionella fallonii LLAP-10]